MSKPLLCQNCAKICPLTYSSRKRYFSTTEYGGVLCSSGCAISWIIINKKCKRKKSKNINLNEGNIKIVCR